MENDNKNKNGKGGGSPLRSPLIIFIIISIVATLLLNVFISAAMAPTRTKIKYNEFLDMLDKGEVSEVVINADRLIIYGQPKETSEEIKRRSARSLFPFIDSAEFSDEQSDATRPIYYTGYIASDEELIPKLNEKGVEYSKPTDTSNPIVNFILTW
ncbi:MAG: ATP-dependent metallopeptidase FtsH/Yme1/Tma family protein, partial [Clostridia bacterium]|nr:ATP-dependent metallopeptidase FtsH/Yme1/Tma family protein [Clostridia bacterium]